MGGGKFTYNVKKLKKKYLYIIRIYEKMNSIITFINKLSLNKYIGKTEKTELEKLCVELDKIKYEKLIEGLKEIIKATKYTKKLKERLDNLIKDLQEEGITQEKVNNLIEEAIEEIKEIDDEKLEEELDKECRKYNKFTESNPAEYIYYDKTNKVYMINDNGKTYRKKNLTNVIKKLKENYEEKKGIFSKNFRKIISQKKIQYKDKKIIIYLTENNNAYFDLHHVINLLEDKSKKDKYAEYKNKIVLYDIRDNEYGGFYIKEYVNQETFYNILLHSNSIYARKFKEDISKILDQLTNQGNLTLVNDKLMLVENKKIYPTEHLVNDYNYIQTYNNEILVNFVKEKIKESQKSNWNKYMYRHIMYFFIITLEDPQGLNRILCKIGYSCDFLKRIKSLENEYKCKFFLINMKLVHSIQDEKDFHNLLKKKFPELCVDLKIGTHDKDETYVFDFDLYRTYMDYVDKGEFNKIEIELEEENKKIMEDYFKNIEERYEREIILKIKPQIEISKIKSIEQKEYAIELNTKYYDWLLSHQKLQIEKEYEIKKEEHRHIEVMRDKDIIMREKDITLKDKELEIKKIELEILKTSK